MSVMEQPTSTIATGRGGRRRPPRTPKGRQVDPQAMVEVRGLLTDRPRRRDLLIEHLHLIQDQYGYLSAAHLAALASEMKMALTEVYEVATFYAHFDVVKEGELPPPPVTVRVCNSLSCAMAGAEKLMKDLSSKLGRETLRRACALHGRLRSRARLCGRSCPDIQGDRQFRDRSREGQAACARVEA